LSETQQLRRKGFQTKTKRSWLEEVASRVLRIPNKRFIDSFSQSQTVRGLICAKFIP
jgi:hypothetical protein